MTATRFRYFVIRICGSGKVCADLKISAVSATFLSMAIQKTWSLDSLTSLPAPILRVLPARIDPRKLNALD